MGRNYFREPLMVMNQDGAALTASTTPTSLLHSSGIYTIPANYLAIGTKLKLKASGRISTIVTTPGTLTLDVRFTGGIIVANGGAMALNIVAKTNVPWELEWDLLCRSIGGGVSAQFMHQGQWMSEAVIGSPLPSAGGAGAHMLPNAAPSLGTGFSSVAGTVVDLFGTWSLNNANSILVHQFSLEAVN